MLIKSERMHIDTADNVTMACEATFSAYPISSLGLVFVLTYWTLAACASFGASETLDVSLFSFMRKIVDILAVFPQGHALVVVTTRIAIAYTVGVANEEGPNLSLLAEVDHFAGGFMAQITDATFCSCLDLVLSSLQLSPSSRVLFASGLLFGKRTLPLRSLALQRSNATACHNQSLSCVCADSSQVDLSQINGCVNFSRCLESGRRLNTHMQLKTVVPDQATSTAILRQIEM
jgi:hypothetical protein